MNNRKRWIEFLLVVCLMFTFNLSYGDILTKNRENLSFVKSVYKKLLNRKPDPTGIRFFVGGLNSGRFDKSEVIRLVKSSKEYKKKHGINVNSSSSKNGSNESYVKELYRKLLNREPDPSGFRAHVDGLNSGKWTRKQVYEGIKNSEEYKLKHGKKIIKKSRDNKNNKEDGKTGISDDGKIGIAISTDNNGNSDDVSISTNSDKGHRSAKRFTWAAKSSGVLEFETSGIRHQNRPCVNGDWEYIFLTLKGENMKRFLLLHAGGGGRAVRYVLQCRETNTMRMEIAKDNLPDWHKWTVKWGNGKLKVYLDGKQIGKTERFSGKPNRCIVGGNENRKRNFLGKWRNFSVKLNK